PLLALLVSGGGAGESASAFAKQQGAAPKLDGRQLRKAKTELQAPFDRKGSEDPYRLHHDLPGETSKLGGSFRAAGAPAYNPGWNLVFELRNMLICSEAVARSALQQTESRGAHARIDH